MGGLVLAIVLTNGPPTAAAAAAAQAPRLVPPVDLGLGYAAGMNDRGDIVGIDATGQAVLWQRGSYAKVRIGSSGDVYPAAINNHGHVLGSLSDGPAFLFRDGALTPVPHPSGDRLVPTAINDRGQVTGVRETINNPPDRPFFWQRGTFTDLGSWQDMHSGTVLGMDGRGQVVVNMVNDDESAGRALVWRGGALTDIGSLGGGTTWIGGISDNGAIVGSSTDAAGRARPFLWRDGTMVDLSSGQDELGGGAYAVNDAGDVVGTLNGRPVMWRAGSVIDLLPPGRRGEPVHLNERGDVAGLTQHPTRPFRWRNGHLSYGENLPDLAQTQLVGIDNHGRVVGRVSTADGEQHVVVWFAS